MKERIICLVGKSGSGKTTIAKELEKLDYNIIKSYTTREPREEGEWGHIFIDDFEMDGKDIISFDAGIQYYQENMIAFKELYGEVYFATKRQYQGEGTSIYVVDPDGAEQVRKNVKDAEVLTMFLMADRENRYDRLHGRESLLNGELTIHDIKNRVQNIYKRLNKDEEIFKTCKCDYVVDVNRGIDSVVRDVLEIIGQGE